MKKKYEFTGETMEHEGRTLHRIRALKDFGGVKAGDLGGLVEREANLSHNNLAWVSCNALVSGFAHVSCNALVSGNARVRGDALVSGNACVSGYARVSGFARVSGNALVSGNSCVIDNARVSYYARVSGDALVSGNACVSGDALVSGNARVRGDALVRGSEDYYSFGPIGSRNDYTTVFRDSKLGVRVACGCFSGSLDDFEKAVNKTHPYDQHGMEYRALIELARIRFAHVFDEVT